MPGDDGIRSEGPITAWLIENEENVKVVQELLRLAGSGTRPNGQRCRSALVIRNVLKYIRVSSSRKLVPSRRAELRQSAGVSDRQRLPSQSTKTDESPEAAEIEA